MKAILVVDIPGNYQQFGSGDWYIEGDCLRIGYKDKYGWFNGWKIVKNNMIALKPMPQRKIVGEIEKVDDFMKSDIQIINDKVTAQIMLDTELLLASGYNLCIDEILGGTE